MGRPLGSYPAARYRGLRRRLWPEAVSALGDLRRRFDLVLIEGAGSPAEVNLRRGEIVNMRVAEAADAPVLLVADVERGGAIAALLGTLLLLRPAERGRVAALVVNRFRGDPELFTGAVDFLQRRARRPVLGVVPYIAVRLPAEDSLDLEHLPSRRPGAVLDVAVARLDRISNFDELQPLAAEPAVSLRLVEDPARLGRPDLIVLPGSKTTASDLARLRSSGLADAIVSAAHAGSAVLGICGGYQMLGRRITDADGVESRGSFDALGLLPTYVTFAATKVTARRRVTVLPAAGLLARAAGLSAAGYEIHMGRWHSARPPAFEVEGRGEGCASADGWVVGTSVHGLLTDRRVRRAVLEALAERKGVTLPAEAPEPPDPYDVLADTLEQRLDIEALDRIVGLGR
jgi:adenosylcobyric acid synthase